MPYRDYADHLAANRRWYARNRERQRARVASYDLNHNSVFALLRKVLEEPRLTVVKADEKGMVFWK